MPYSSLTLRHLVATTVAVALIVSTSLVLSATTTSATPPSAKQLPANTPPAQASVALPIPTVTLIKPKMELWPDRIEASGNIMPWHESLISSEVGGLRLISVLVSEGDSVKKGQLLARLNAATVETDLDMSNAQLAEAQAVLAQAVATMERANRLAPSGGVSRQELTLYETQKHTADARLNAARAQVKRQQLRLEFANLTAPDDGIISSSTASEGSIVQAGSELFRLIRQGRLEWRAEVKGELLMKLAVGQEVMIKSPLGAEVQGHVRRVSPTVDMTTRNGVAYVDLPQGSNLKAGLNVSGSIVLGKRKVMLVPSSAVMKQGENSRVFTLDADNQLQTVEIKTGRAKDNWVEILAGIDDQTQIVGKDIRLLKEGDLVKKQVMNSEVAQQ